MSSFPLAIGMLICASLCSLCGAGTVDCTNVLTDTANFTGICNNKWDNLKAIVKPTQAQVGYAWVQYKLDKNYKSASDTQDELDSSPIPAAIGPDSFIYIVDDHHVRFLFSPSRLNNAKLVSCLM